MLKRIQFAAKHEVVSGDSFAATWYDALATAMTAGEGVHPVRATCCATLPQEEGSDARHDVISFQWFEDAPHLARFDAWLATDAGVALEQHMDELAKAGSRALVVAEEHVMRGADWLEEHWRDGGPKYKHMAVAMRAAGLTQAEFSELWVSRAGQVRTPGATSTVIPDAARGLAYVQNHPAPRADGDWPYDAVNEVYFDDLDALRVRVEFFAQALGDQTEDDLVSENWFVVAHEEVVGN